MKIQYQVLRSLTGGPINDDNQPELLTAVIDELVGVSGLPVPYLTKAIKHLKPFLEARNLDPAFWQASPDTPLPDVVEIEPFTAEEQKQYFFAFNSDQDSSGGKVPIKLINALEDDLRLYFAGRYNGFDYEEAKELVFLLLFLHGAISDTPLAVIPEDQIADLQDEIEFDHNMAMLETLLKMFLDTPAGENPAAMLGLLARGVGFMTVAEGLEDIEIEGTGQGEQEVLITMIEAIRENALDRELPEPDQAMMDAIDSYRNHQEESRQVNVMLEDFMTSSEPSTRIISMGFGHVNPDGSHTSVQIDAATGSVTENIDVADPSVTSFVVGDSSNAKH